MCWYLKYISHKQHIVRSCFLIQSDLISIVDKSIILLFFLVVPSVLCFSFSYFLPSFFIVFFFQEFILSPLLVAFALNKQLSFKKLRNKKTLFIFTYILIISGVFHSFVSRSASDRFTKHLYLKILFIWYHSVECFWI